MTPVFLFVPKASAATFEVDSTLDATDDNIGNGLCDDGSGNCTLRAAIQEANATPEADTITFAIAGAGPHTIALLDFLPDITTPIDFDGTTQTGAVCGDLVPDDLPATSNTPHDLRIVLDGSALTYVDVELGILKFESGATGSSVQGLNLVNAGLDGNDTIAGLVIGDDVSDMTVNCNYFGITPDGTTAAPNIGSDISVIDTGGSNIVFENNLMGRGVQVAEATTVTVQSNLVGTDETGFNDVDDATSYGLSFSTVTTGLITNNVVVGSLNGVNVSESDSVSVTENYIGVDLNGGPQGNAQYGFSISQSNDLVVTGNVIANNDNGGLTASGSTGSISDNTIRNNTASGAFVSGTAPENLVFSNNQVYENSGDGVVTFSYVSVTNNTIYDNAESGVQISASGSTISGNAIGLDASDQPAGNATGIQIFFDEEDEAGLSTVIGGDSENERNIISANDGAGVHIYNDGCTVTDGAVITGNYVGLDASGRVSEGYGNGGAGIQANEIFTEDCGGGVSVYNHSIGGDGVGEQNIIAGNESDGVQIFSQPIELCDDVFDEYEGDTYRCAGSDVFNIAVLPNSIYGNGGLGINLATDTDNDGVADVETGPATKNTTDPATYPAEQANHFVAYPEITDAVYGEDYVKATYDFNAKEDDGTIDVVGYRLDFYLNDSEDPSGYGQGKTHLGYFYVDGDESAAEHTFATDLELGDEVNISATATLLTTDDFIPVDEETLPFAAPEPDFIARVKEFFMPTASAEEVTPTEGSYIYGSTSEFSSFTSLSEDTATSLADTGSSTYYTAIVAGVILCGGAGYLVTRKQKQLAK